MNTITLQSVFERNDLHRATRCESGVTGMSGRKETVESQKSSFIARATTESIGNTVIGGMIAPIVLSSGMINLLLLLR